MLAARVVFFSQSFDSFGFTYLIPDCFSDNLQIGNFVRAPLKGEEKLGLVFDIFSLEILPEYELKEITEILSPELIIGKQYLETMDFISRHYFTPIHNALSLYVPKHLQKILFEKSFSQIRTASFLYEDKEISLSQKQNEIFQNIVQNSDTKHLIYGVTGSGKTQIYMALIQHFLSQNSQTLLLIPEIILTSQIASRIEAFFGNDVVVLHSAVSAAKKTSLWKSMYTGDAKVIIGTRSALFYPYKNLGAIIIDEEHDSSFVSDVSPRYHSLEVAEYLAETLHIPLILGSGTPKITTLYRAIKGEFILHHLLTSFWKNED